MALGAALGACSPILVTLGPLDAGSAAVDVAVAQDVARPPSDTGVAPAPRHAVDLLLEVDNSNSMLENQLNLVRAIPALLDALLSPPRDASGAPVAPAVTSLHLGVISQDLGTPGSTVPSCANSDVGDDGLLNPIRYGQALRAHEPWVPEPHGVRPARCLDDPNQYPSFLTFDAASTDPAVFRDDFVCNAYLRFGGCGIEQQLEAAYRALVVHDARARPGNTSPNAGFVRDGAVLAIVLLTDEEDGSVRDCRFAEAGVACSDAISVFDSATSRWASGDLNLRFYLYAPGSAQDPTWPLERYMDPAHPARGFTSLKPGHPEDVVFAALAGVPMQLPTTSTGGTDWGALLGRNPDGSDGLVAMSAEGPISMRQRNIDPACSTRVVPACRREGSTYNPAMPACDTTAQYYAWPSRRIANVARRFDETYGTGLVRSICRNDDTDAVRAIAGLVQRRLAGR